MRNMDEITGKINESELDSLVDEDIINGGTNCVAVTAVVTAVIVATYSAGACPSYACTEKCNK